MSNLILERCAHCQALPDDRAVLIALKNIYFGYDAQDVLKNVCLEIKERDFMAIIGPNGGGKTTLLKIILGLLKPSQGELRILGKDPADVQNFLGYVPQFSKIDNGFPISVWETVLLGRLGQKKLWQTFSLHDKQLAEEALARVQMLDFRDRQIGQLSTGQRQRVFIARALANQPRVLFMDEPMASLDKNIQESMYALFKELNKTITLVMVTHDISVISTYVNKIACLNQELFLHETPNLDQEMIERVYGCPFEYLAHGTPHRVLHAHEGVQ